MNEKEDSMLTNFFRQSIKNNLYKRGFVFLEKNIYTPNPVINKWFCINLDNIHVIYYEAGNKCCLQHFNGGWICLCGSYCMDVLAGHMDFKLIVKNLAQQLERGVNYFFDYLDYLNGRFVCIYSVNNEIHILNDATAARSVYYSTHSKIVASHYNLINIIQGCVEEPFFKKYQKVVNKKRIEHKSYPWVLPGDMTPFADVKFLPPNHELNISNLTVSRFWPRTNMEYTNIADVSDEISKLIKVEAETLVRNYKVIESLTAGFDSRITLSAVKDVSNDIIFYTYHDSIFKNGNYESIDRELNYNFAKKLCAKEGLNFKEIKFNDSDIDNSLMVIFEQNHYHVHLPQLLPYYFNLFTQNSMHLRSNLIEIVRENHTLLNTIGSKNDFATFAIFMNWSRNDEFYLEAVKAYEKYYYSSQLDNVFDYSPSVLLYWEHRVANWLSGAVLSITDFVSDTFQLFNCRRILQLGVSLPTYYKNRSIIYDEILKRLWPDLLEYGLPNEYLPLNSLINKNKLSSFNYRENYIISSGNLFNKRKKPYVIYESRIDGISFGFSGNKLEKGDYCEVEYTTNVVAGLSYCFQIIVKSFWFHGIISRGINYEILIDDNVIYSLSTSEFFSANQILYCFKALDTKTVNVKIRLIVTIDIKSPSYCGVLDVLLFDPKQDFSNEFAEHPVIFDTYTRLKEIGNK